MCSLLLSSPIICFIITHTGQSLQGGKQELCAGVEGNGHLLLWQWSGQGQHLNTEVQIRILTVRLHGCTCKD